MARRMASPIALVFRYTRPPVASASARIVSWFGEIVAMAVKIGGAVEPLVVVAVAVVGFNAGVRPRMSTGYTATSAELITRAARLTAVSMISGAEWAWGMTNVNAPETHTRFFRPGIPAR